MSYCLSDQKTSVKFEKKNSHARKWLWKYLLQNGDNLSQCAVHLIQHAYNPTVLLSGTWLSPWDEKMTVAIRVTKNTHAMADGRDEINAIPANKKRKCFRSFAYVYVLTFIQYFARNWPWYSLRGLHIRITWFSVYGIRIPWFSLYGIHMPLLPYMVIQLIVLGMALLWAAMDSSLSQGPLLWRHNDMSVIVSRNTRERERDTQQRLDNANARRLQTVNRQFLCWIQCDLLHISDN